MKQETKKRTIRQFFDPYNRKHLKAYQHRMDTGKWPKKFFPKDVYVDEVLKDLDLLGVRTKIIHAWLEEKL